MENHAPSPLVSEDHEFFPKTENGFHSTFILVFIRVYRFQCMLGVYLQVGPLEEESVSRSFL